MRRARIRMKQKEKEVQASGTNNDLLVKANKAV